MPPRYFLVPGWDFPAGAVQLGSIITNPAQPQLSLFQPDSIDTPVSTTSKPAITTEIKDGTSTGLIGSFLHLFGLGDDPAVPRVERNSLLAYSVTGLRTRRFTPSEALQRLAVAPEGRVAQFCRASGYSSSVYMVTAVKTIRGASLTAVARRGPGWRVSLGVESVGDGGEGEDSVVFAVQLTGLRLGSDGAVHAADPLDLSTGRGTALQASLDAVFGGDMFEAVEGFDEEDGSPCTVIAPSPTRVDLLTASSASISGTHR